MMGIITFGEKKEGIDYIWRPAVYCLMFNSDYSNKWWQIFPPGWWNGKKRVSRGMFKKRCPWRDGNGY